MSKLNEDSFTTKFLKFFSKCCDPLTSPICIGPKLIPFNYLINIQKTGTIILMSFLMWYFNNYSRGSWLYLSLHGTYGLIWFLKDMVFPDKGFQHLLTIPASIIVSIFLISYWLMGVEMMIGIGDQDPSPKKIFFCYFIFTFGNVLMICTDLQKYIMLKYNQKGHLIDTLFFANNRNTNYLGEIMIYLTFAMATGTKEGYILLISIWVIFFGSRMYTKELSLSKKHGYEKYKENSYFLLFKFFKNDFYNIILYLFLISVLIFIYYY